MTDVATTRCPMCAERIAADSTTCKFCGEALGPDALRHSIDALPDAAVKKATNLIRDARLSVFVGLIPLLGLVFILRLVQWYLLKKQYPALVRKGADQDELTRDFRSALPRLWVAVLLWPVLILIIAIAIRIG